MNCTIEFMSTATCRLQVGRRQVGGEARLTTARQKLFVATWKNR